MSKGNQVVIESVPMDRAGQPVLTGLSSAPGKVRRVGEGGRTEVLDAIEVTMDMDRKVINIPDARKGRPFKLCKGAKVTIRVSDAKDVNCPGLVTIGDVVFAKDVKYELTYDDIPIKGFTKQNSASTDVNSQIKMYPEYIETQKDLLECIFKHEGMYTCSFVRFTVEFPPEIQLKLDVNALLEKQQLMEDIKRKQEEEFRLNQRNLSKEREKLISRIKEYERQEKTISTIQKSSEEENKRINSLTDEELLQEEATNKASKLLLELGINTSTNTIKTSASTINEDPVELDPIEEQRLKQEQSKKTSKK